MPSCIVHSSGLTHSALISRRLTAEGGVVLANGDITAKDVAAKDFTARVRWFPPSHPEPAR